MRNLKNNAFYAQAILKQARVYVIATVSRNRWIWALIVTQRTEGKIGQ